jgi:hypothetical protein
MHIWGSFPILWNISIFIMRKSPNKLLVNNPGGNQSFEKGFRYHRR